MSNIPVSNWVLDKRFFEAKLVDDFDGKYKKWFLEYNGAADNSASFTTFLINLHEHSTIELYRFPNDTRDTSGEHDYFEKDDDNYAIPRFLFEPVTQK